MHCPACGAENPDKAKFCLECGEKLTPATLACAQCGAALPPSAKFCLECGAKVGAPAPPPVAPSLTPEAQLAERLKRLVPKEYAERLLAGAGGRQGERRTVTILFCDVKGSTAMAQNLDPEDVLEIMNGAFEVLIPPVYRYEGTLARLMGDAILAFFGAPLAHEDDAERACRAGLEILVGAQEYAKTLLDTRSLSGFAVRVGINTGLVVVGEVGSDLRVEYTAMGDAINLAARMEQAADPGTLLVTEETYRRVRHAFETKALPPVMVKGHDEPVPVYRVLSARRRGFRNLARGVQGVQTSMIGREGELKALQDACYVAAEDDERLSVTVLGEPGIGKSRLLQEFEAWLEGGTIHPHIWRGSSRAELQSTPYALLRDLIQNGLEVEDGASPGVLLKALEMSFTRRYPLDGAVRADWTGALLGLPLPDSPHLGPSPDPQEVHDRGRDYLLDLLQSDERLPVVLLEDIHWADNSSLDMLSELATPGLGRKPALFIFLSRPTLLEQRPHWLEGAPGALHIELRPLAKRDSRRLVEDIFQKIPDPPPELREQIVAAAEGSPLFLEELIKVLIQEGVITCETDAWQVHMERLDTLYLPPSLAGILQARIDRLPAGELRLVQQASIFGRLFWDQAIANLSGTVPAELVPALQSLHGRELIFQHETSQVRGALEFVFKHAALRDVAYEGILKKTRRQYHAQAAGWLEGLPEIDAQAGMIAEHYELAGQAGVAVEWYRRAAERAAQRYANQEAERAFSRALALLETLPGDDPDGRRREQRWGLLLAREQVLHICGKRDAQLADLEALESLAAGDPLRQARIALRRTYYCEETCEYAVCQSAAEQAIALAASIGTDGVGDDAALAAEIHRRAQIRLGFSLENQGHFEQAEQVLLQALESIDAAGDLPRRADCLHNLALVYYYQGNCERALTLYNQSLDVCRKLSDRRGEAITWRNLTPVYHDLRQLDHSAQAARQAVDLFHLIGDRSGETVALNNLAIVAHALGRLDEARRTLERALGLAREIGSQFAEGLAANNLALVCLDLDDAVQAVQYARLAVEITRRMDDTIGLGYALTALGLTLEAGGPAETASGAYTEALEIRRSLDQPALAVDDLTGLARVCLAQGDLDCAAVHLMEALNWVDAHSLEGVEYPIRLYWTAMLLARARGDDSAADDAQATARTLLESWAVQISDPKARDSYLNNVPLHRKIIG